MEDMAISFEDDEEQLLTLAPKIAGAHNKYESFDVWFEANGPELIKLDEILDKLCVDSLVTFYSSSKH